MDIYYFRVIKTYLEARPVFLQTKESFYGHFLIYYALTTLRLLELKVLKYAISVGSIIFNFIRGFNIAEYTPDSFISNAYITCVKKEIKSVISLSHIANL